MLEKPHVLHQKVTWVLMKVWRPCAQKMFLRSTAHIVKIARATPPPIQGAGVVHSDPSQLIDRSQDFLLYLIVDSPTQVQPFSRGGLPESSLLGRTKKSRMVWCRINDQSGIQYVPHTWAGLLPFLVSIHQQCISRCGLRTGLTFRKRIDTAQQTANECAQHTCSVWCVSASDHPRLAAFSQQFQDINADLVGGTGDPRCMSVEDLEVCFLPAEMCSLQVPFPINHLLRQDPCCPTGLDCRRQAGS